MRRPLFLTGAPRSGSTFLTAVLNHAPQVHVTSEARLFVLFQYVFNALSKDSRMVAPEHAEVFRTILQGHLRSIADAVYLHQAIGEGKDASALVWLGEKYPHYADPYENGGVNAGCMDLIEAAYPDLHLIHIHRHPIQAVASIQRKGWLDAPTAALVWAAITLESEKRRTRCSKRSMEIAWWNLCHDPDGEGERLCNFLALPDKVPLVGALRRNADAPAAFSSPETRPLADADLLPLEGEVADEVWSITAQAAAALGYVRHTARPLA